MAPYAKVLAIIKTALVDRPAGTKVQVEDHQVAEIAILDYIQQQVGVVYVSVREAHGNAVADTNKDLTWNTVFADTDYSFTVCGWDANGDPVTISLIDKTAAHITVKTLTNATLYAIAKPYITSPE